MSPIFHRRFRNVLAALMVLTSTGGHCLAGEKAKAPAKVEFKLRLAADFGTCPDGHKALKDLPIIYGLFQGLFDKKVEELDQEERDLRGKVERGEVVLGGDLTTEDSPKTRVICSQCGFSYNPGLLPAQLPEFASWDRDEKDPSKFTLPFDARVLGLPRLQAVAGTTYYSQSLAVDGKHLKEQSISYGTTVKIEEVLEAMRGWIAKIRGDPSKLTKETHPGADVWNYEKDEITLSIMARKAPDPDAGKIQIFLTITTPAKP